MSLMQEAWFRSAFSALTGYSPLRWQSRLFDHMIQGDFPDACDLPTGMGKTSVIPIWLLALAASPDGTRPVLPRRLIYIVNRRTVVDQATDVVERMRAKLGEGQGQSDVLAELRTRLRRLGLGREEDDVLAVSTLRGELADNEEWKADPARLAIVIGTIDMIGSKLLFSGYGDGPYKRAHHAGLIGQDVLIVHDEAHLSPALSEMLRHVANVQVNAGEPRPARVMELSATSSRRDSCVFSLLPEDEDDRIVRERLHATKRLRLTIVDQRTELADRLSELAMAHDATRSKVVVYVRSPEQAQSIAGLLEKRLGVASERRAAVLTGTIRGYERDRLVKFDEVYRAMLDTEARPDKTVYLVCTSAGEVGIDLDADHMVCDVTTLDSLIQRLGRVNRRGGEGRAASVDVVAESGGDEKAGKATDFNRSIDATRRKIEHWQTEANGPIDVSPGCLRDLLAGLSDEEREALFSPKPVVEPLTDMLLDAWSLTSVDDTIPGRPKVAAYLHGITSDPPETVVVWRREVKSLYEFQIGDDALADWFRECAIETHERLSDRTERVLRTLNNLLEAHRKKGKNRQVDFGVILLDERGKAEVKHLSEIVAKEFADKLAYRTVVLPTEIGGLDEHGMMNARALEPAEDVAEWHGDRQRREVFERDGLIESDAPLIPPDASLPMASAHASAQIVERHRLALSLPDEGTESEAPARYLILMARRREVGIGKPERAASQQTIPVHSRLIVEHVDRIAAALGLEASIREALRVAAKWHDAGKANPIWQRYACNDDFANPLAKSRRYRHGGLLGGYRHEFGSLLEAEHDAGLAELPECDLALHLIAAHHGHCRPHFLPRAWDAGRPRGENSEVAVEAMRRFGRLQQRFGRWGLAWLESLLRCADIAASQSENESFSASSTEEHA